MKTNMYEKLQQIAKPYTLLYVEDDESILQVMQSILSTFFGTLLVAKNGQEGLAIFHEKKPDLIITDISMPLMNGIDMIKAIRQNDKEIPIMVNSAFSDKEYLLDSIYVGVDRYTIKPIKHDEFLESLYFLLTKLKQKDEADMYEKIQWQTKINQASTHMLTSMIEAYPHPTLIYNEQAMLHLANTSAMALFDFTSLKNENIKSTMAELFIKKEGYLSDLMLLEEGNLSNNRVMVKTKRAKKIYIVSKRAIDTDVFGKLFVYSFTDITRIEYEKQKSQNLSMYLREIYRFSVQQTPQRKMEAPLHVKEDTPIKEQNYDQIRLQAMHYTQKTSAMSYVREVGEDILEELSEMDELEGEIKEQIHALEDHFALETLYGVAHNFTQYSKTIGRLFDFKDIAFSLEKLSTLLLNLQESGYEKRKITLLLSGIAEDLKQWRKMIFTTQEALDIHYLDASLLSSCLQIEKEFSEDGGLDDGGDLDLF